MGSKVTQVIMTAVFVSVLLSIGTGASNASNRPTNAFWELFQNVCLDNLYNTEQSIERLEQTGWQSVSVTERGNKTVLSPVFFYGFRSGKLWIFEQPKPKMTLVFGEIASASFPNMKCYLATSDRAVRADALETKAGRVLPGIKAAVRPHSSYQNRKLDWRLKDFSANHSTDHPYNRITIEEYRRKDRHHDVTVSVSVIGMLDEASPAEKPVKRKRSNSNSKLKFKIGE